MNEINRRPLVDILTEQTGKQVVMRGDKYVCLIDKTEVEQTEVDKALKVQQEELVKEQQKAIDNAIQESLDKKAQEFRWDDMKSARAGAMSIKDTDSDIVRNMKENAQKLTDWYYEVWAYASQLEADVKSGNREIPTIDEVLEEMPKYEEQ